SHGIAAVATGGSIQRIELTWDQGGSCLCPGGNAFLTLSAGYLGSLGWGVLLLLLASGPVRRYKVVLLGLGAVLAGFTILYVRSGFGVAFGTFAAVALIAAARLLPPAANRIVLTVLGLTSCLYAILDIKSDILDRPEVHSDAHMLFELTGVHTIVWGVAWIAIALLVSGLLFKRLYDRA
ncbi:MAG: M50 family metallopeptidase, partial [Gemmatimonadota bacterium]